MSNNFNQAYNDFLSLTNLSTQPFNASQKELKLSLKRTGDFLNALGSPHEHLKFIHITGTSGKGSVAYLSHQILHASGQSVGTYLSPHTTSYLERFQFNDKLIDPEILAKTINESIKIYEEFLASNSPLSFFELSTCIALKAFHNAKAKWCVLEVGCGGRWDATNVIPAPAVAIITNIDKDHTEILGNSLTKIAIEKSGIIKKGSIILCGETRPSLKKVFTREAIKNDAALFFIPPPHDNVVKESLGYHQQHNAALAIRAAQEIGIDEPIIWSVINKPKMLPCRFETIQNNPQIILDGAHSGAKMHSTVQSIKKLNSPVHIIFGCTAQKDAMEMLKKLAPIAKSISTTRFTSTFRKAANPQEILKFIPAEKRGKAFLNYKDALEYTKSKIQKTDAIIVTGSLYLSGDMRGMWISEEEILKNQSSYK
ncbi:hypothetical protein KJ766_03825 [Patescibacteria group bacterium]|nr:hypothetical protein [Patescibacteria group bacterium]